MICMISSKRDIVLRWMYGTRTASYISLWPGARLRLLDLGKAVAKNKKKKVKSLIDHSHRPRQGLLDKVAKLALYHKN